MAMERQDAAALLKADHRDVEQSLIPSAWNVSRLKPMAAQGISLILVVEHETPIRWGAVEMIFDAGWETVEAANADEALERFSANQRVVEEKVA